MTNQFAGSGILRGPDGKPFDPSAIKRADQSPSTVENLKSTQEDLAAATKEISDLKDAHAELQREYDSAIKQADSLSDKLAETEKQHEALKQLYAQATAPKTEVPRVEAAKPAEPKPDAPSDPVQK